jgi:hypothetical protein
VFGSGSEVGIGEANEDSKNGIIWGATERVSHREHYFVWLNRGAY